MAKTLASLSAYLHRLGRAEQYGGSEGAAALKYAYRIGRKRMSVRIIAGGASACGAAAAALRPVATLKLPAMLPPASSPYRNRYSSRGGYFGILFCWRGMTSSLLGVTKIAAEE